MMSDYIDGWDMQDAIGRAADLEAELIKERRARVELRAAVMDCIELLEDWFPLIDDMRCASEIDSKKIDRLQSAVKALTKSEADDE